MSKEGGGEGGQKGPTGRKKISSAAAAFWIMDVPSKSPKLLVLSGRES